MLNYRYMGIVGFEKSFCENTKKNLLRHETNRLSPDILFVNLPVSTARFWSMPVRYCTTCPENISSSRDLKG